MSLSNLLSNETRKRAAWNKASYVPGYDPNYVRRDRFGSLMQWQHHGRTTDFGWEIDHVVPTSLGGLLAQSNEQATQWKNNRIKSNRFVG
jgi:5-methylcytosine-specific restriction endonuclease McrA